MKEALFYSKLARGEVRCSLCPRKCRIAQGKRGFCKVRENRKGILYSLVYGKLVSINSDPIEKKPLFHFAPGTHCLSIATVGCNLACLHCQNAEISQTGGEIFGNEASPEAIVKTAKQQGLPGIAYTYVEPTIFFEYALDTMKLAKKEGLYNVWVSNGYTTPAAIKRMAPYLDAVNVDVKGDDKFYREMCMAPQGAEPVYEALNAYRKHNIFFEITNLLIPGKNDSDRQIGEVVERVMEFGSETPIHFSAFFPHHKTTGIPPTPLKTLENAYNTAREAGMQYVYIGNARTDKESTFCPSCGKPVITRASYIVSGVSGKCPSCGTKIPLHGMEWAGKD